MKVLNRSAIFFLPVVFFNGFHFFEVLEIQGKFKGIASLLRNTFKCSSEGNV